MKAFQCMPTVNKCCGCIPLEVAVVFVFLHNIMVFIIGLTQIFSPVCEELTRKGSFSSILFAIYIGQAFTALALALVSVLTLLLICTDDIRPVRRAYIVVTFIYVAITFVGAISFLIYFVFNDCTWCFSRDKNLNCHYEKTKKSTETIALVMVFIMEVLDIILLIYFAVVLNTPKIISRPPTDPTT